MFKTISKLNIILGVVLLLMAIAFFIVQDNNSRNKTEENKPHNISEVCFESNCFNVEIADTSEKRETGLMNRKYLKPNSGMLFSFEEENKYNFWMKNVLIPLDMIWIDQNRKVVFIKENAEPCKTEDNECETFVSDKKAKYVLEISGGMSEEIELNIGDEVEFK